MQRAAALLSLLLLTATPRASRAQATADDQPLGTRSAISFEPGEGTETLAIQAGTRVYSEPDRRSPPMATVEFAATFELLERRPDWAKLRLGDWNGWVPLSPEPPWDVTSPFSQDALPPRAVTASPEKLAAIRSILGADSGGHPSRSFGPFTLYSDFTPKVLARLEPSVEQLAEAYRTRFGIEASPGPGMVVAIFANQEDYRHYERLEGDLRGLGVDGHAGNGVAALYAEHKRASQLRPLLLHELTHLLNRSALGPDTPIWLEEGLANDLAYNRVDRAGRLLLGTLEGQRVSVTEGPGGAWNRSRHFRKSSRTCFE